MLGGIIYFFLYVVSWKYNSAVYEQYVYLEPVISQNVGSRKESWIKSRENMNPLNMWLK